MPVHEQRQLHFVQHLELEQIQAVTVNGANMEIGETDRRAQLLLAARVDALLQFSGGLLREGKCNDVAGLAAGAAASDGPQQGHHALRNDFGLAGSGAGDQLWTISEVKDRAKRAPAKKAEEPIVEAAPVVESAPAEEAKPEVKEEPVVEEKPVEEPAKAEEKPAEPVKAEEVKAEPVKAAAPAAKAPAKKPAAKKTSRAARKKAAAAKK